MSINALTIIETMKKWVSEKQPISPSQWLDASLKINILRGDFDDRYFELEHKLAKIKSNLVTEENMTVAKADTMIKATSDYLEMRKLGGTIKMIEEMIKISKKQSTLKENEWVSGQ
jgi:hypothetical protein